jgi:integrase
MAHRQQGSIGRRTERRPDGTLRVSSNYFIMYRAPDGTQKKETVGPRKKEAAALLAKRLGALHDGTYREVQEITFREYAQRWIKSRQNALKPSTLASYEAGLGVYADERRDPGPPGRRRRRRRRAPALVTVFGDTPLQSITVSDVNAYLGEPTASVRPKTRRNSLALLTKLFGDAVEDGYLAVNRLRGSRSLQRPKALRAEDEPEIEILTPAEVNRLLDAMDAEHYPLFLTGVYTGVRLGELLALQWGDLDRAGRRLYVRRSVYKGQFYVPKTKRSRRSIDIGDQLLSVLEGLRLAQYGAAPPGPEALIFPSATGRPLDPDNLRHRVWAPALAKAKLRHVRIHSLRHTYASMLIAQGENIKYISSQLGHASVQITIDRYGHLFPDRKRTAAARLEEQFATAGGNESVTFGALRGPTEVNGAIDGEAISS